MSAPLRAAADEHATDPAVHAPSASRDDECEPQADCLVKETWGARSSEEPTESRIRHLKGASGPTPSKETKFD